MHREILFRGKTEPGGHWVYGSLISRRVFMGWLHWITYQELTDKKNELWSDCETRVKSETVGQYTGLKDENDVKIFDKDIVHDAHTATNGAVLFDEGAYYVKWGNVIELLSECHYEIYVCGSSTETPELLEVE